MGTIASQITSITIVYSTVYSDADQRKHQSCASLAFVRGIHRGPMNFPHKWPVTRKMFPFDDVIMCIGLGYNSSVFMSCDKKLMAKWAAAFIEPIKLLWYKVEHDLIGFTQVKCLSHRKCGMKLFIQTLNSTTITINNLWGWGMDELLNRWIVNDIITSERLHIIFATNKFPWSLRRIYDGFICHYDPRCTNPT